jgi:arsenate reductase (glutaredoxin)
MLAVYQYPKCSTCRNALRWLTAQSVPFESIDIVSAPPSVELLEQVLEQSGLPVTRLFNTSGQSYRDGNYKERLKQMSRAEALAALAADGKLIKRPLVLGEALALVGFDASAYEAALAQLRGNSAATSRRDPGAPRGTRP